MSDISSIMMLLERIGILELTDESSLTYALQAQLSPAELRRTIIDNMASKLATAIFLGKIDMGSYDDPVSMRRTYRTRCWVLNDEDLVRFARAYLQSLRNPNIRTLDTPPSGLVPPPPSPSPLYRDVSHYRTQAEQYNAEMDAAIEKLKKQGSKPKKAKQKKELIDIPRRIVLNDE